MEDRQRLKNQMIFKRYEIKYLLTSEQRQYIQDAMKPYMKLDEFGHSIIRNIYFDTDNYRLVRHSIESRSIKKNCGCEAIKVPEKMTVYLWN